MANNKSAEKRARQNEVRRMRNRVQKSRVRSAVKEFVDAVGEKDKQKAEKAFVMMVKLMDTAARKGVFHKNAVSRKKSRMSKLLNKISVA